MRTWAGLAAAGLLLVGCKGQERGAATKEGAAAAAAAAAATQAKAQEQADTSEPARPVAAPVEVAKLLGEYKDNEVRADAKFKGKFVQTSGVVGDVKKDITGDIYVTVGTGELLEIPVVQCFVGPEEAQQAASLSKGTKVTVQGRVEGLMMNVLVKDCEINPMMRFCQKMLAAVGGKKCTTDKDTGDGVGLILDGQGDGKNETAAFLASAPPDKYDFLTQKMSSGDRVAIGSKKIGTYAVVFHMVGGKPTPVASDVQAKVKAFFDSL